MGRGLALLLLMACKAPETPPVSGEPTQPAREWVSVTTQPCAMDSEGYVDCWVSDQWETAVAGQYVALEEVSTDADYISSARVSTIYAHRYDGPTDTLWCIFGPALCRTPMASWSTAGMISGLQLDGHLATFEPSGVISEVSDSGPLHALAGGITPAAVTADNVVVTMMRGFEEQLEIPHDREVTHLAPGFWGIGDPHSACVLDVAGEITCFGEGVLAEAEFPNPPYRDLDGDRNVACAVREADDVIDCSDGTTHDLGAVVDLQVFPHEQPSGDGGFDYTQASLCVITTDNAIRCAGPHYPPDLQAQLAALPR